MLKFFYTTMLIAIWGTINPHWALAQTSPTSMEQHEARINQWLSDNFEVSVERILENISGARQVRSGDYFQSDRWGLPGAVLAAPSVEHDREKINPSTGELGEWQDYRYVWKRDTALTMRLVFRLMYTGPWQSWSSAVKYQIISNYVNFVRAEQAAHKIRDEIEYTGVGNETLSQSPLSEPEYDLSRARVNAMAQPNLRQWGEPQDDGPPLQTMALLDGLRVLRSLTDLNDNLGLEGALMDALRLNVRFMLQTIPKSLSGQRHYYERWEETRAELHFAVLIEQRYALLSTLNLVSNWDDQKVSKLFGYDRSTISDLILQIEEAVEEKFLLKPLNYIGAHFSISKDHGLVREKPSNLDVQVLMASLETNKFSDSEEMHYFSPSHPWVRSTFVSLYRVFAEKYVVNKMGVDQATGEKLPGFAWGRYPEDSQHFNGDPWFITTFAAVQHLLWNLTKISQDKEVKITTIDRGYFRDVVGLSEQDLNFSDELIISDSDPRFKQIVLGLTRAAKETFFRAMVHAGNDGELSEVFDQEDGFRKGIKNLTWSWVELLKTVRMFRRASDFPDVQANLKVETSELACQLALEKKGRNSGYSNLINF